MVMQGNIEDNNLKNEILKNVHDEKPVGSCQIRANMPKLHSDERIKSFEEVELGLSEDIAVKEAFRCLGCNVELCVGCRICENFCPDACIKIETEETETGKQYVKSYEIDSSLCMFCGFCQEICPTRTLSHSRLYELSTYDKKDMVYGMDVLTKIEPKKNR